MKVLIASLAGLFALAALQPQDPPPTKPTTFVDPHTVGRSLKTYPQIVKDVAPKREKVEHYKADLKYSGSEPYNDDPIDYSGFVVFAKDKDAVECYIELGQPGKESKPILRIYQNDTTLTIVYEDTLTYSEYAVDPTNPKVWRPWTFFAFALGKELAEDFDITVEADGEPIPKANQKTEEEHKQALSQLDPAYRKMMEDEAARLDKVGADLPLRVRLSMKARDTKGGFMRIATVTLDKDLLVPVSLCAINRDTSTMSLEVENLQKTPDFDRELFKKVPALKQEKTAGGALKYKKVS